MPRPGILFAAFTALVAQGCALSPALDLGPTFQRDVDALAAAAMAQGEIPGMAVVLMHRDEVILARGYGVESLSRADPVTPRTQFMHNSIGKHFAAAAVLALVEDGQLGLDDPVVRHLPDFTLLPPGLTVRHLLTQTSGVRESNPIPAIAELLARPDATPAEMRQRLRTVPVDWPPGSRWSYSNTNYLLLGELVAQAGGQALGRLLETRLFRPHGLASLKACPFLPPDAPGVAVGYSRRKDRLVPAEGVNNEVGLAAGGLCGSALDLARWTRLLASGRIVSTRSYEAMTSPGRLDDGSETEYGFGLALIRADGVRRAGHSGIGFGYSSVVAYYPDAELTIAILANRFGYPDALERQIARRVLRLPAPDRTDIGISPAQRQRWAGRYDVGMFGWMPHFFERDGRLWFELFGPTTTYALIQTADGVLVPEAVPDAMQFRFSDTPNGVAVRIYTGGTQAWTGVRQPERR